MTRKTAQPADIKEGAKLIDKNRGNYFIILKEQRGCPGQWIARGFRGSRVVGETIVRASEADKYELAE